MKLRKIASVLAAGLAVVSISALGVTRAAADDGHDHRDGTLAGRSFLFRPGPIPLPGGDPVTGVQFVLAFHSTTEMTFTQIAGPTGFGVPCENETVHVTRVGEGIFFLRWIEASGISVSHVDDLSRGRAVVSSVIPTSLTGTPAPLSVSFTGPIGAYHGAPQPACANNGSGN